MNKFFNYWSSVFFILFLTTASSASAESNNFLGGIAHAQVSADLSTNTAGLAAIEVGPRNYRTSGTLGLALNPCNRIKVTGEWLWQDIDYVFLTSTQREWVSQAALGLGYQLVFNNRFINYLDLSGYYSHAPSKNLIAVDYLDQTTGTIFSNVRRIAGSNAGGLSPAVYFNLWQGAEGNAALNWDDVAYDNLNTPQKTVHGFGGTVGLAQAMQIFQQSFKLTASAALRAPFNFYRAEFDWINPLRTSQLSIGIFGDYSKGKSNLPNTSLVGINLSYAIDTPVPHITNTLAVKPDSLLAWVSNPAVYMPQVLSLTDQTINKCPSGSELHFDGFITTLKLSDLPIDFSKRFPGNGPITFSLTKSSGDASISAAGLLTATVPSTNIVVTAKGPCSPLVKTNSFNITAG